MTTQPTPATWVDRGVLILAVAACLFMAAGLGLRWIGQTGTDLPPAASMANEFAAAAAVESVAWGVDARTAATRAWIEMWIALNGQYDARLFSTALLVIQLLAVGAVLIVLARRLPAGGFLALAVMIAAMLAARSAAGPRPLGDAVWASALVGLSMLQVAWMTRLPLSWWRMSLGLLCGAFNLLAAPEGIASTAAVVAWHAIQVVIDRTSWPARRGVLIANGILFVLGLGLILSSGTSDARAGFYFAAVAGMFAWPMRFSGWGLILWAPAVFCVIRVLRGDRRRAALAPLAILALALASIAAGRCAEAGVAGDVVRLFGLSINAACLVLWWCTSHRSAESRLILSSIWVFAVFFGLMHGGAPRVAASTGTAQHDPATLALRRAVMDANGGVSEAWSNPRIREILPPSIRAPLALGGETGSPWSSRVPDLGGRDELPAIGTWRQSDASIIGEFVSDWLNTSLPLLEVRFCGTLHPPDTAIVLRTADGLEIAPWTISASAPDRWKRLTFAAPRGAFQMVVRDASTSDWIAVAAPVELGRMGWLARKFIWVAQGFIVAGAFLGLAAIVGVVPLMNRVHAAWLGRGAPMFPWHFVPRLALAGCAVYFALNLDTTAGPNDSGGYLNSAKLLAGGQIATEPRTIFGGDDGDNDAQLHLPTTFCVAADGRAAPVYPVGLPLIIAAFAQVLPLQTAVGVTIVFHLIFGTVFTHALARLAGLSLGWSALAATIIGLSPVYLFEGLQPVSDVPALAWTTAAVVWAWRGREQPRYAVLAGIATALAVMIRPSNLLCFVPVLICLAGHWRQLAWWALAGLPGAAWLAWYQATLYGSPFVTGYGDAGPMFGLRFFVPTLRSYVRWLPEFLTPIILFAVIGPFVRKVSGRLRVVLTAWAVSFISFYAVYWCTWDTWFNMRFVLPAAPAMVVLALIGLREACRRLRIAPFTTESFWRGIVPTGVLVCGALIVLIGSGLSRRVLFWVHANHEHAVAAQWARDHLPEDAVVFAKHATGSLAYYTDFIIVRTDREEAQRSEFLEAIANTGRPIYAVTHHWETPGFRWEDGVLGSGYPGVPGRWERLAALWEDHVFVWMWKRGSTTGSSGQDD